MQTLKNWGLHINHVFSTELVIHFHNINFAPKGLARGVAPGYINFAPKGLEGSYLSLFLKKFVPFLSISPIFVLLY
ncbi:MAG: hypothetical protein DRR08_17120 [Candidatus Parabeggiatoa sp. nov. 2]|nr:MAG: hypothetical protein DRR08_17120 [Gammaproteobacteria bacterium]